MRTRRVRSRRGWSREAILTVSFAAMAAFELFEAGVLEQSRPAWLSAASHGLQVLVIVGATWLCLRAWQERLRREEVLGRAIETVTFAQEAERRRLAREMHDGVAQLVVSAAQHLDTCSEIWAEDPGRARRELDRGLARLRHALAETRQVLQALRPTAVDALGLVGAVRQSLAEVAAETGWTVDLRENVRDLPLPAAVETAVFRIVQEAVANARQHASSPRLDVRIEQDRGWLELEVSDAGAGFSPGPLATSSRGLGLLGMRERARLLGGTCTIDGAPGRGARIAVRLPLGEVAAAAPASA